MAKKRFYGEAVTIGASAISVRMPRSPTGSGVEVPAEGVAVTMNDLRYGVIGASSGNPYLPECDVARVASIIVPAGVHAIINFNDGRQLVCYCADKPVKVKPSMLSPAKAWRKLTDSTTLFTYLLCDANGTPITGTGTSVNPYSRMASGLQVNVAVRSY